jgi:hypothetical protein
MEAQLVERVAHQLGRCLVMNKQPTTRDDIAALARNAGLDLPPDLFDELVEAYRSVEPMLMRLRRGRGYADEPAHVFDPRKFTVGKL